ncbi:UNVERIFIED_CONTAM: hypothetical protein FKN15_015924 [Acipenser sinensis]
MGRVAFAPLWLAVSWPTLLLALTSAASSSPSGPASDTCTTLVQGKFFGYFSSSSVFPYSNGGASASPCSWIIQNPDPRRYTLYMKVSKPTSCCNPRLVRTFQYDSFLETTRTYLGTERFDEVLKLCDTSTRHAFLQSGKQFLQMKKLVSRDEPSSALAGNGEFMAEYLVVGNRNPSVPACQVLCKWLESCLVSSTAARPCGIMQTPCQCWDVPPRKQDSCYRGGIYLENCIPSVKESNRDAEIAGGWSMWSPWAECNSVCGGGVQMRSRTCQAPFEEAFLCEGVLEEGRPCNKQPCTKGRDSSRSQALRSVDYRKREETEKALSYGYPSSQTGGWSMWSPWAECNSVCGGGVQMRSRTCQAPFEEAFLCEGVLEEGRPCNKQPCTSKGRYSSRSQALRSVDNRKREETEEALRYGYTSSLTAKGRYGSRSQALRSVDYRKREETEEALRYGYPSSQTVDPAAEEWSPWSVCSTTCGEGWQSRTRFCVSSSYSTQCSGPLREQRQCNNSAVCSVHGAWDEWSPWSLCSSTCGRGYRDRTRTCKPPQFGGNPCEGPEKQTKFCNIALCPVDGNWNEWSSWSSCSASCSNGTQQRIRECNGPSYGGSECHGRWVETRDCFLKQCPVDGKWQQWGLWGSCTKTCDGGMQERERICYGPFFGGEQCPGPQEESRLCNEKRCPVDGNWNEWSSWSSCSASCSNGTQQRIRECNGPSYGGSECHGRWVETRDCFLKQCPVDGKWQQWGLWGSCTKTCDGGTQERERICYGPFFGGEQCPGPQEESRLCNEKRCPEPHEICEEENYAKVVWKKTPSGEAAAVRCPPNASGLILRKCTLDEEGIAYWEPPTYVKCVSNDYRNIQIMTRDHLLKAQRGLIGDGVSDIIKNLMEISQDGTSYSGDLLAIMDVLKNMTEIFRRVYYSPKAVDLQNFVQVVSNLLSEENRERWDEAQLMGPNAKELFRLVEDFIDVIGLRMKDFRDYYQVTENLVDGNWNEWSSWSSCSASCSNGTQQRIRECNGPSYGGSECHGRWVETRDCFLKQCPVDGKWQQWGLWGSCTKTCDGGTQERERICYGPFFGGEQCPGPQEESRLCNEKRCPEPHEICEEENYAKVVWKKTPSGEAAAVRCPPNASGLILRKCTLDEEGIAYWEPPTYVKCVSNDYRNIQIMTRDHLLKAQRGLIGDGVSDIIKNLMEISQDGTSYSGDLLAIMDVLKNMTEIFRRAYYTPKAVDLQNFVQVVSNLLSEENRERWDEAQLMGPNAKELFRLVEDFIDVIGLRMKDFRDYYQVTENLVLSIHKSPANGATDISFPKKNFVQVVSNLLSEENRERWDEAQLMGPNAKELFRLVEDFIDVIGFHMKDFRDSYQVTENLDADDSSVFVIGTVLYRNLGSVLYLQSTSPLGAWSTRGCRAIPVNSFRTKCVCDRLSTFAILARLNPDMNMDKVLMPSVTLIVGCGVSSLTLLLLIIIYVSVWRYIRSERSVILINFCLSIISSNVLILIGQTQTRNKVVCTLVAAFLHFFFLSSFCWVLTEAWQSYMAVTGRLRNRIIRKRFLCLGWGLPALVVAVSVGFTKAKGYGTINYCWLSLEGGLLYAFVGPAAAVVLVNMVIGILVFNKLVSKDGITDKKLKERAGASLWSSCVVLPLLALTWMSAVLAITDRRSALFQILFAVFDSLEGFVIVMVHCILRREVQDAVKCRVVDRQEEVNGDSGGSFQNGHAQLMTDFEKDVDIACRSVLNKDILSCRSNSILGTLKRSSLQGDEKLATQQLSHQKGVNFNSLPTNMTKLHLQNMADYATHTLTLKKDKSGGELPSAKSIYICDGELFKQLDADLARTQTEKSVPDGSSYVLLPSNTSTLRAKPKKVPAEYNISIDQLTQTRLIHLNTAEGEPDTGFGLKTLPADRVSVSCSERDSPVRKVQNISSDSQVTNSMCDAGDSGNSGMMSKSETVSTLSMSSLERQKSRYAELDFEKIMHTRKRHQDMFQDLNRKLQHTERESPPGDSKSVKRWSVSSGGSDKTNLTQDKQQTPNKRAWEGIRKTHSPPSWVRKDLETLQASPLELKSVEWEKAGAIIPLVGQEIIDLQTEV